MHRCLQRQGLSRLPEVAGDTPKKQQGKRSPSGDVHIAIVEVRTEAGQLCLCVAIDRPAKFASAELHPSATKAVAAQGLRPLIAAVSSRLQTMLTDNRIQFTTRAHDTYACKHLVARVCEEPAMGHRLTSPNPPWTNGQGERMNRTWKEVMGKQDEDQTHHHLKAPLYTFLMADNFAKRLKTLRGLTPYEYIGHYWQKEPECFTTHPDHHTLGLNT